MSPQQQFINKINKLLFCYSIVQHFFFFFRKQANKYMLAYQVIIIQKVQVMMNVEPLNNKKRTNIYIFIIGNIINLAKIYFAFHQKVLLSVCFMDQLLGKGMLLMGQIAFLKAQRQPNLFLFLVQSIIGIGQNICKVFTAVCDPIVKTG